MNRPLIIFTKPVTHFSLDSCCPQGPNGGGLVPGAGVWSQGDACSWGGLLPGGLLPEEGVPAPGGVVGLFQGTVPAPGAGGLVPGGACWRPPPGRLLLRTVRIPLECILVTK